MTGDYCEAIPCHATGYCQKSKGDCLPVAESPGAARREENTVTAGRELDALVAEKVMGWIDLGPRWSDSNASGYRWMRQDKKLLTEQEFEPSTDIAAAWAVVKLFANFKAPGTTHDAVEVLEAPHGQAHVHIYDTSPGGYVGPKGESIPQAEPVNVWADTAPLAICLAALKAVGVEVTDG
jgi:ABA sandwich protein